MSRKDRATGETEAGATCSGATLGGSHQALKSLRRVGNTHSFAPDRPEAIEMKRQDFLGDPAGASGVGEGHGGGEGGLHKGRGLQVRCHPQTRKGVGHSNRDKDTGF